MIYNLKKKMKQLRKEGKHEEAEMYNCSPTSYVLPDEYDEFVEEFTRNPGVYIMKPVCNH